MKTHVWIPAAGLVLLAAAMMGRPSVESPAPRVHPPSERLRPKEFKEVVERRHEARPPRFPESMGLTDSRGSILFPPSWVEDDGLRMRTWLLGLTNEELARVVGTPQLNGWVSIGLEDASAHSLEDPHPEMGDFLAMLNLRILAVQAR